MDHAKLKTISGGQTGVDRAALDAAIANNIACGGWCPVGRKAEDGPIPEQYPLIELDSPDYVTRTLKNIEGSVATVIIYFETPRGGTELTLAACKSNQVPYLEVDGSKLTIHRAKQEITEFIDDNEVTVLNVAGPRASEHADAYAYTFALMNQVLATESSHRQ